MYSVIILITVPGIHVEFCFFDLVPHMFTERALSGEGRIREALAFKEWVDD